MTTLFTILENQLLGQKIDVYKKTIEYQGSRTVNYDVKDWTHAFQIESVVETKKIISVRYIDGEYDRWPSIQIVLDGDVIIYLDLDSDIKLN